MKKIILLSAIAALTLIISLGAQAAGTSLSCMSLNGSNRELIVFVADQNLFQVRVVEGYRQRVIPVVKLANQNIEGVTLYSVAGGSALLELENQILDGVGGKLRFNGDTFSCID